MCPREKGHKEAKRINAYDRLQMGRLYKPLGDLNPPLGMHWVRLIVETRMPRWPSMSGPPPFFPCRTVSSKAFSTFSVNADLPIYGKPSHRHASEE